MVWGFTLESIEMTAAVIDGRESLGGSESSCLGLARALVARGHEVHVFSAKINPDVPAVDATGLRWHSYDDLRAVTQLRNVDVLVALRHPTPLEMPAKFRIVWCQDLLANESMKHWIMGRAWTYDRVAYVSAFHRTQWEGMCPELAPLGWVTKNGYDPAHVPSHVTKDPNRLIHVSRPERGLSPLLAMWPALRKLRPHATIGVCRYNSMYDADGWGRICAAYDRQLAAVNADVGGITFLGELGKPALYKAIAEAAVMWYPGVSTFGETSCIAAIEAQACGTPFVGSFKGALPETIPTGVLIPGDALHDDAYQTASVAAVADLLDACKHDGRAYRDLQKAGRAHVRQYTYAALAGEWEAMVEGFFEDRYQRQKSRVLARLIHEDDYVMAKVVAAELMRDAPDQQTIDDLIAIDKDADRVIAGLEHTADDYADNALDPTVELKTRHSRLVQVVERFKGCTHILDVACGSGAFALGLAEAYPDAHITAIDYAAKNIEAGTAAAAALGLADRITWICAAPWDATTQRLTDWWMGFAAEHLRAFDGLWVGEFIEHVADCTTLIDALETVVAVNGLVLYSCPFGPLRELVPRDGKLQRGHVHHFRPEDIEAVWGQKPDFDAKVLAWQGSTLRGSRCGNWIISYRAPANVAAHPTGTRPTEPLRRLRPYYSLSAGIITNDTLDLRRCLNEVWPIADEIVIGDCGARPGELEQIQKEFPRTVRVIAIGKVADLPDGFSEARNRVLDATTGDWFLWIDSDEVLVGAQSLAKYLDAGLYRGYCLRQNHLMIDAEKDIDRPIRVFKKGPDIRFYGVVHEQPQLGDCNGEIEPSLDPGDVQIAHTGHLVEAVRRWKCIERNLPLLVRDRQRFKDRKLGQLLVLRDWSNLALWSREQNGGQMTDEAEQYYNMLVGLFEEAFADVTHKYHAIARRYYDSAIRLLPGAIEAQVVLALKADGTTEQQQQEQTKPDHFWARTADQLREQLIARVDRVVNTLPKPMEVSPVAGEPWKAAAPVAPLRLVEPVEQAASAP